MLARIWTELVNMFFGLTLNEHVRIAVLAMLTAQILKILFYYLRNRRFSFKVFVQPGGMPSSHTAMVLSLAASIGFSDGWGSKTFAIALIFSMVVMYDAAGVRRAAGKQAAILNMLMQDLFTKKKINELRLKELLGHTPLEVFFGGLLGIVLAFAYHLIYNI
ncbi:MAG: divergent PAP2 family protein [Candidatus Margulisbacteria bacterium]|jgi:acid phosphatase family membrane protein YuiD|nr:divergent PAP2 family protein [Candidatus Margulisiibacteriota bacterium]